MQIAIGIYIALPLTSENQHNHHHHHHQLFHQALQFFCHSSIAAYYRHRYNTIFTTLCVLSLSFFHFSSSRCSFSIQEISSVQDNLSSIAMTMRSSHTQAEKERGGNRSTYLPNKEEKLVLVRVLC